MNFDWNLKYEKEIELLKILFQRDYSELLEVFSSNSLQQDYLIDKFKTKAFAKPVNCYVTGRVGSGKKSLINCFLDDLVRLPLSRYYDSLHYISYLQLKGNIRFFYPSSIGSTYDYENLNRLALGLPQLLRASRACKIARELPFGKQSGTPYEESDQFLLRDFTKSIQLGIEPEKEAIEVGRWQNDPNVKPDVIFYVIAPHHLFLREDCRYFDDLLDKWGNVVIPVLNIHSNPDSTIKPTPQNIQDARQSITKIYQLVLETNEKPPIFEVNCLTGEKTSELIEYVCQVLPHDKVGGFGNTIRDDLKKYVQKQRQQDYYHNLAIISSLVCRITVKNFVNSISLLHATVSALIFYGIGIFKNSEQADIFIDIDSIMQQVNKVIEQRTVQIKVKEDIIRTKVIPRRFPIFKEIKGQTRLIGYETKIDEVKEVIEQTEKIIGTEYLRGGYEVIFLLLSVGLAVEIIFNYGNNFDFNVCFELAEMIVERKLKPIKLEIERLVDSDIGEKPLISLLEKALLS